MKLPTIYEGVDRKINKLNVSKHTDDFFYFDKKLFQN
jgi:hypothetical protein